MTLRVFVLVLILALCGCKRGPEPSKKGFRSGGAPAESESAPPPAEPPRPPPAPDPRGAADVERMQLGIAGEVLPPELSGVRLGMELGALKHLRPNALFAKTDDVALESAPPGSLYEKFSYHFRDGKLASVYLTLRHVTELSDDLLTKARAKWGAPSSDPLDEATAARYASRGERVVSWRLPGHVVQLQKVKIEPNVRLYVTTRHP